MKVDIVFESTDGDGELTKSVVKAVMNQRGSEYKLTYVEDLSGDGSLTRSSIVMSQNGMRIVRKGELTTDFLYGKNIVHNSKYQTPYGTMPVTVETVEYEFFDENVTYEKDFCSDFLACVHVAYKLTVGEDSPICMDMRIKVFEQGKAVN